MEGAGSRMLVDVRRMFILFILYAFQARQSARHSSMHLTDGLSLGPRGTPAVPNSIGYQIAVKSFALVYTPILSPLPGVTLRPSNRISTNLAGLQPWKTFG